MLFKYRSKDLILHRDTNEVSIGSQIIRLTPKEMGVLEVLYDQSETTVGRSELLQSVWGAKFANDQGLTQAISRLREVLSKSKNISIITIPKKGYQLRKVQYEPKNSMKGYIKPHLSFLIIVLLGFLIYLLIFVRGISIRIDKPDMDKQEISSTNHKF